MIEPLGDWVLGESLRQLAEWRRSGLAGTKGLKVAVNLSAHQLRVPDFLDRVASQLKLAGLPANALELEITESVAMQRPEHTVALLRERGVWCTGLYRLRFVTHLDVSRDDIERAIVEIRAALTPN